MASWSADVACVLSCVSSAFNMGSLILKKQLWQQQSWLWVEACLFCSLFLFDGSCSSLLRSIASLQLAFTTAWASRVAPAPPIIQRSLSSSSAGTR